MENERPYTSFINWLVRTQPFRLAFINLLAIAIGVSLATDVPEHPWNIVGWCLVLLAGYFRISVDRMLRQDLRSLGRYHLGQLLRGHDALTYTNGKLDPT